MKKKIMLLGGNYFQVTATKMAKQLGHYVISVDYLPSNPGHRFADEYYNVSTTDKEAVLELAQKLNIDGIISYASDISAPTAAYVAEKMGLPTNPYESVKILTQKDLFRSFLKKHNYNVPRGKSFNNLEEGFEYFVELGVAVIVKPADASGSKGVNKVEAKDEFERAYKIAEKHSRSKKVIIEEFIQKIGYQIDADGFLYEGKFKYFGVMDQHNDLKCNPYVPIGLSGPSVLKDEFVKKAKSEIQRLMSLLNMKFGALNMEYIFNEKGEMYILEIGPRNGGNLITDVIYEGTQINLAQYTIEAALGLDCSKLEERPFEKCVSSYIIHSEKDGEFYKLDICDSIKADILRLDMFVNHGDKVNRFENAGEAIGAAIIQFNSIEEMSYRMDHMDEFIKVLVK